MGNLDSQHNYICSNNLQVLSFVYNSVVVDSIKGRPVIFKFANILDEDESITELIREFNTKYYQNFSGDSLGQMEAFDVGDVAKWRQKLI